MFTCVGWQVMLGSSEISRAHSFLQAAKFRAKPQNLPFAAEFHKILQKFRNDQ